MKGFYDRCPYCGGALQEGAAKAEVFPYKIGIFPMLTWTPRSQAGKFLPKGVEQCGEEGKGLFCPVCRKVFAEFEIKE